MENRDQLFNKFQNSLTESKIENFKKDGRIFDFIISQQLDTSLINQLYLLTNKLRHVAKTRNGVRFLQSLLSDKSVMLYFEQPSSRTFISFLNACHILGLKICEIRDTSLSSEVKGESLDDTLQTFSSYVDLIIMRTKGPSVAERASWLFRNYANRRIPVINGGSGSDQHPTQALLDIYTLIRSFKGIRGLDDKTLLLCGDLKRGRTVRSLSLLMKNFKNVKLLFVAPQKFQIEDDILELLDRFKVKYNIFTDGLKGHLSQADAIYMTRIQDEHDRYTGESKETNFDDFKLTYDDLPLLKSTACIMHPFPRRDEIDVLIDSDPRSKYWRQERNGMWTRSALIAYIFNVDTEILKY